MTRRSISSPSAVTASIPAPTMATTAVAATLFHPPAQPPLALNDRLRLLLLSLPESWSYTVFWRAAATTTFSPSYNSCGATPRPLFRLSWGDGFISRRPATGLLGDCSSSSVVEWFYTSSCCTFQAGDGSTPARALEAGAPVWLCGGSELLVAGCERSRQAYAHGVQTLVCVPVAIAVPGETGAICGVLELGTSELVAADLALVLTVKFVLGLSDHDCGGKPTEADASILTNCCVTEGMVIPDESLTGATSASIEQYEVKEEATCVFSHGSPHHSHSDCKVTGLSADEGICLLQEAGMISAHPRRQCSDANKRRRDLRQQQNMPNQLPNHVQSERQRREKMNSRLYALRAAVPTVTRLDKVSLLSDAVDYIKDLKAKVEELEAESKLNKAEQPQPGELATVPVNSCGRPFGWSSATRPTGIDLEVRLLRSEAVIRMQSDAGNHPTAWLMEVLRELGMSVQHASVSAVGDRMLQDVVATAPAGIQDEEYLRAAILGTLDVDSVCS